jgi:hypothetical protein
MRIMRRLGVDRLRVTAVWQEIAPDGWSRRRPRFRGERPAAYPKGSWARLDRAVRLAHRAGLETMIDVGFSAPLWAARPVRGESRGVGNPSPKDFAAFARAVARRYDGRFRAGGTRLPRVSVFTLWNEPNHPGFLSPQWRGNVAVAADHYRRMVQAAYPAIKLVQPDSRVLIGGLASGGDDTGRNRRAIPPLAFLRRLACVDDSFHPLSTGACRDFQPVPADGLAHHPYNLMRLPAVSPRWKDWATIADLPALSDTVQALVAAGRLAPGARQIWLTEFGYETNERVLSKPWTPAEQARLLPWAERLAYQVPDVVSFPQFLLADIETRAAARLVAAGSRRRAPGSWQSGLYTETGRAKPAAASFRLSLDPLLLTRPEGLIVSPFGHVRAARAQEQALVQWRWRGAGWKTLPVSTLASPVDAFSAGWPALPLPSPATTAEPFLTRPDGTLDAVAVLPDRLPDLRFRLLWRDEGRWYVGPAMAGRHLRSLR